MMITIAVADNNQTYSQGLKTMLEQVEEFEVVLLPDSVFLPENLNELHIDMLLVDEDLYEDSKIAPGKKEMAWPVKKTLVLTMDCNEVAAYPDILEAICKGAGKREFTARIMKLMTAPGPDGNNPAAQQGIPG
jgi:DNA-binding NarL/FixJ family response regulator